MRTMKLPCRHQRRSLYRFLALICFSFSFLYSSAQTVIVSSIIPASGTTGSTVVISGTGFNTLPAANTVYFGDVKATVQAASATALTVTIPVSASCGPVSVTTGGVTAQSNKDFIVLFGSGGASFNTTSFSGMQTFSTVYSATDISTVDFDGDGKPDPATLSSGNYVIEILPNTSSGAVISFGTKISVGNTGPYATAFTVADIDGDGKKDLLVANASDNNICVFRNTSSPGSISFAARQLFTVGYYCQNITAGDLDNDGKPDLAVTSLNDNKIGLLRNTSVPGTISFALIQTITAGSYLQGLLIRDLDKDGKQDIAAVSDASPAGIQILKNTSISAGTFSFAAPVFLTGLNSNLNYIDHVVAGDLDGDGNIDLSVTNSYNSFISVFRNSGTAGTISFDPKVDLVTLQSPTGMSFSDMDGDGKLDILVNTYNGEGYCLFKNKSTAGTLSFDARKDYSTAVYNYSSAITASDLNGDGRPDMVAGNRYGNFFVVFQNMLAALDAASFSPANVPEGGGISIVGNNLSTVTSATLGGTPAIFVGAANTTIDLTVGTGNSGDIVIMSSTGSTDTLHGFTYMGPEISSFSPAIASPGNTVVITGNHFSNATAVDFGGTPAASFIVNSDMQISAVIGTGASGNVRVTTAFGHGSKTGFTYTRVPIIQSFDPPAAGIGSIITIKGRNFTGSTVVKLGSANAASFTVISDSVIKATTALTTSGNIAITNPYGTGTLGGFTFISLPSVSALSPASAIAGTSLIITGTNFSTVAANDIVFFGTVRAAVTAASTTSLTVTVPPGAKFLPVSVTVNNLTAYSAKPFILKTAAATLTTESFTQKINTPVSGYADNITAADFDGDGKPDLASITDSLFILRNRSNPGDFSFQRTVPVSSVGHYTIRGNVADINGDGKPDIVTTSRYATGDSLTVFQNISTTGNIGFTTLNFPSFSSTVGNLIIVDLDFDGRPDIVVNGDGPSSYRSWVYRNITINGVVAFATPAEILFGSSDYNICAGDLDGDGKPDLLTSTGPSNTISLLRNTSVPGTISFATKVSLSVSGYPTYTYLADMDADGKIDIIVQSGNNAAKFATFRNTSTTGSFSFPVRTDFGTGTYAVRMAVNDLDGDGKPDIALTNGGGSNTVSIYKNTSVSGTIALAAKVDNTADYNTYDIEVCDLDGDGKPEIAMVNKTLSILRNSVSEPVITNVSPLRAAAGTTLAVQGVSFTGATAVSFNGIPATSFTVVSDVLINAVLPADFAGTVCVRNAAGADTVYNRFPVPHITDVVPLSAPAGSAILVKGYNFNPVAADNNIYFGAVKGTVVSGTETALNVIVPRGATPDRLTLTTRTMTCRSLQRFDLSFAAGDTAFTAASFAARTDMPTSSYPVSIAIADLNNDGKPDIAESDQSYSTLFKNTGDSAVLSFVKTGDSSSQFKYILADLNADGKPEKINSSGTSGATTGIYPGNSMADSLSFGRGITIANTVPYTNSSFYALPAADDMNGDGKTDLVSALNNSSTSTQGSLTVLQNLGVNNIFSFPLKTGFNAGTAVGTIRTLDLDGDSIPDVFSINQNTYTGFKAIRNTGTAGNFNFGTPQEYSVGTTVAYVMAADIDGDGKPDVITANSSANTISVFKNTSVAGAISFAPKVDLPAGAYPVWLAVGDLNGDGKPEIIAANQTENTVSVYKNASVSGSFNISPRVSYNCGGSPNSVAIGDLDRDGIPDIAVLNYSPASVSIFRNIQATPAVQRLCNPFGSTTLSAGLAGASYQWQESIDSIQYNNISDNIYFGGTATNTLALTNIPSSWYGKRYRCIAGTTAGHVFTVRFVNTWTGALNNDWMNPANWSCGTVPDTFTDAYINSGTVMLNTSTSVRSLTIQPGATFTVATGAVLTIMH